MLHRVVFAFTLLSSLAPAADVCPIRDVAGLYRVTGVRCEIDGKPCAQPEAAKWVKVWMENEKQGWIGVSSSDPFGGYYAYGFSPDTTSSGPGSEYSVLCQ